MHTTRHDPFDLQFTVNLIANTHNWFRAGTVLVGPAIEELEAAGWERLDAGLVGLTYTDTGRTRLTVLRKTLAAGEALPTLPQDGWSGCILLFKQPSHQHKRSW